LSGIMSRKRKAWLGVAYASLLPCCVELATEPTHQIED
jgi:hypothetical protein